MSIETKHEDEAAAGAVVIVMNHQGRRYRIVAQAGETLLEAARRAKAPVGSNCERGDCGACMVSVSSGEVRMRANNALSEKDLAEGLALACQSVAVTAEVVVDLF